MTALDGPDAGLDALTALTDATRRAAYEAVLAAGARPLGRDEIAELLGVGRTLAAFHLDKLVDAGLLEVSYGRRNGRSGPGAGRPAKLYRVSATEHAVSAPPRDYRTAAELLAESVERSGADTALFEVAREHGRRASSGGDVRARLTAHGYVPEETPTGFRLNNCPFHRLAEQFPPLVCGMNLALISGLLDGTDWTARMDAAPGRCCVVVSKNNSD
ncbi:putative transcriptional regulator [Cryptosporangium arvum DSM 44712]|uniref:Putative transcriptional regulator n=1 Tax=Cryptosporangium arvum DSM 44712 TaxID=927661 RepID=A0A010YZI6_9ACTN|nr:transcriptional regulator [Cryptosporangium arvum]EXG80623.1 putative transcriptional regulator [Cryptosporangium arvum DSM 44712]